MKREIPIEHVHESWYVHDIVNTLISMNSPGLAGFALEQALASKLRELLGGISWLHDWQVEQVGKAGARFDLIAKLTVPRGIVTFYIECKGEMRPSAFHSLTERWLPSSKQGEVAMPVLAMPFVSPRLADLCVQHGWSWYDLAGNCHLEAPGTIYLERTGLPPVHRQPRPKANLSTPEAARVIRALLAPQNASMRWTQRQMEVHFGELKKLRIPPPSLGLVNKVVQQLRDEAFIEALGNGGFRLRDPIKLLFAWRDAYRFDRLERRDYFSLLRGMSLREALYKLELHAGGFAAYAAFSAAEFQAPHVRQPKTWIYVRQDYLTRLEELAEAKPVDSGENVVVLIPDDDGVFYPDDDDAYVGEDRMSCTNPVQTYIDLFHCGGRGLEAAEAILEQRLKPKWSRAALL